MAMEQKYRVYQLTCKGIEEQLFTFRGIEDLHKVGFEQPPADQYRMVFDGTIQVEDGEAEESVLEDIFSAYNCGIRPKGYRGHSLSMSDVVELYGNSKRSMVYSMLRFVCVFPSILFHPDNSRAVNDYVVACGYGPVAVREKRKGNRWMYDQVIFVEINQFSTDFAAWSMDR